MVRAIVLFVAALLPAFWASAGEIDSFLQSREVAAQIYFKKSAWQLTQENQKSLQRIAKELLRAQGAGQLIRVEGFASPEGTTMQNFNLSLQRASAVKDFLLQQGVKTELFLSGYGENNLSTVKLSEQRRVDVAVYQVNRTIKQLFQKSGKVERFVIQ